MRIVLAALLFLLAGLALQTWRANFWAGEGAALRRERVIWTVERTSLQAAIAARDLKAGQAAQAEARRLTIFDRLNAGDVSSAYQKGLAVGRALANVKTVPDADPHPAVSGLHDYRTLWADDAYRPGI